MKKLQPICSTALLSMALLAGCGGQEEATTASTGPQAAQTTPSAQDAVAGSLQNALVQPADEIAQTDDGGKFNVATASVGDLAAEAATRSAFTRMHALAATTTTTNLIRTNFDTAFAGLAPGWWVNFWGKGSPSYEAARASGAGLTYAGAGSQRFKLNTVPTGGAAHLVYTYKFVRGTNYTATLYLRSDAATQVAVQFRRDAPYYELLGEQRVTLGTTWTAIKMTGTWNWNDPGSIRIVPITLRTNIYVDEMSIASNTTTTTPPVTGGLNLLASGPTGTTLANLASSSMDQAYTGRAPGWSVDAWGGATTAGFSTTRETRTGFVYSGAASQRFSITNKNGGEVQIAYGFPFVLGKTYRARLRLRADANVPVQVFMRRDAHPWDAFASRTVTATPTWQTVEIEGAYVGNVSGSLRLALKANAGTVYIDDMLLQEVSGNPMTPHTTSPIPDTLFGMHVNRLGAHTQWPGLGTRIVRLWNTATTWRELETAQDVWNWTRLDQYVDYVTSKGGGAAILYTMGQTPQWASSTPNQEALYGPGASGAPKDMNDWRDYVRTVARRYVGKIRYWQLWNEPDYWMHWTGSMATLAEMARIAREELLAADPTNRLVGPGLTVGEGMRGLEDFLFAGGGAHVDMIGFHWYYGAAPEGIALGITNVRNLMRNYGLQDKPLWNTEGAFACNPAVTDCAKAYPTTAESRSTNARALLTMATKGLGNFSYHVWEGIDNFSALIGPDYVTPNAATGPYAEAVNWLKGASVLDGYAQNGQVYMVKLNRGGEIAYVLWTTTGPTLVNLPAAWAVTRIRSLSATETAVPSNRQITIGTEPVMLRP